VPRYAKLDVTNFWRFAPPANVSAADTLFVAILHAFGLWVFGKELMPKWQKITVSKLVPNLRSLVIEQVTTNARLQNMVLKNKNPVYTKQFKPGNGFWGFYKAQMKQSTTYASQAEISALANIANVIIHVYDPAFRLMETYNPGNDKSNRFVALLRLVREYDRYYALLPTYMPKQAPPLLAVAGNNRSGTGNTNSNNNGFDEDSDDER
jgi:hypothetical protein